MGSRAPVTIAPEDWQRIQMLTRAGMGLGPAGAESLLAEIDALRAALDAVEGRVDDAVRVERVRCAGVVSWAADAARESNRKKAAAELDLLARDIVDYREVSP